MFNQRIIPRILRSSGSQFCKFSLRSAGRRGELSRHPGPLALQKGALVNCEEKLGVTYQQRRGVCKYRYILIYYTILYYIYYILYYIIYIYDCIYIYIYYTYKVEAQGALAVRLPPARPQRSTRHSWPRALAAFLSSGDLALVSNSFASLLPARALVPGHCDKVRAIWYSIHLFAGFIPGSFGYWASGVCLTLELLFSLLGDCTCCHSLDQLHFLHQFIHWFIPWACAIGSGSPCEFLPDLIFFAELAIGWFSHSAPHSEYQSSAFLAVPGGS